MDNESPKFYLSMKNSVMASLALLAKASGKTPVKPEMGIRCRIELDEGTWYLEPALGYPLSSHVLTHLDQILILEEVNECLEVMLEENFPDKLEMRISDSEGNPVENPDYKPFLGREIIMGFLTKYVATAGSFEFNKRIFDELYSSLEQYVYSEGREVQLVSPLHNLELLETDTVNIGSYTIRKLVAWEIKQLIQFGFLRQMGQSGFIDTKYCIEIPVKLPSKRHTPDLRTLPHEFVNALRLFKSGAVDYEVTLHYEKGWETSWGATSGRGELAIGTKYELTGEDIQSFKKFWQHYQKLPKSRRMQSSIRWFNKAYREFQPMDKVLDLAIALETLYGVGDRLDLYVAYLLGKDPARKVEFHEAIEQMRDLRGAIVHSGHAEPPPELASKLEDITRLSINQFLQSKVSHKQMIQELKNTIVTGEF